MSLHWVMQAKSPQKLIVLAKSGSLASEAEKTLLFKMLNTLGLVHNQLKIFLLQANYSRSLVLREILGFQPKAVLLLGDWVSNYLFNVNQDIDSLRSGHWYLSQSVIFFKTIFTPEILLKNPEHKKITYQDLLETKKRIHL